jgi:hypothetical protein
MIIWRLTKKFATVRCNRSIRASTEAGCGSNFVRIIGSASAEELDASESLWREPTR